MNKRAPGEHYLSVLKKIAEIAKPRQYLEIGVETGRSLAMMPPYTRSIGIDPDPKISLTLPSSASVLRSTSDDFFLKIANDRERYRIDLAFIDGMHLAEYALRDFCNAEILGHSRSIILFHDAIPLDERTAGRERPQGFWTGDIWKTVALIVRERPDLRIMTLDAAPSGFAAVLGAKPGSPEARRLRERISELSEQMKNIPFSEFERNPPCINIVPAENGLAEIEAFFSAASGDASLAA